MVERQKLEAIAAKHYRNKRQISLSRKEKKNYDNDTTNDIDLNQGKGEYLIPRFNKINL